MKGLVHDHDTYMATFTAVEEQLRRTKYLRSGVNGIRRIFSSETMLGLMLTKDTLRLKRDGNRCDLRYVQGVHFGTLHFAMLYSTL